MPRAPRAMPCTPWYLINDTVCFGTFAEHHHLAARRPQLARVQNRDGPLSEPPGSTCPARLYCSRHALADCCMLSQTWREFSAVLARSKVS